MTSDQNQNRRRSRHVLGGPAYVPPSDKITLGYIGVGTEGIREMLPMLAAPEGSWPCAIRIRMPLTTCTG